MAKTAQDIFNAARQTEEVFDTDPKLGDANDFLNKYSVRRRTEAEEEDTVVIQDS
jgi:hypothetical protein